MTDITEVDKENVRFIWQKLFADPEANGRTVVLRLFTDHPETKKYFKNFKNISTMEEMQKSAQIRRHGKAVMNGLNNIIENLDDWNAAGDVLTSMAKRHIYVHKVDVYNFQIIFNVIIKIMEESLGTTFTQEIRESWLKLFQNIYNYLENSYRTLAADS
ncbi:cytoglobin-2-like [Heptranchias perlo]|uniref:cytoglobin-2-like n=1 Tax=Heptranchias perlo TaxID=212740 RepID=UPI00355A30B6